MNSEQEDNLINLKVLARLGPGDTLRTRAHYFQIETTGNNWHLPSWVTRWWYGESRANMIEAVSILIRRCLQDIEQKSLDEKYQRRIINSLVESKTGLKELINRYRADAFTSSRLEIIISDIDHMAESMEY